MESTKLSKKEIREMKLNNEEKEKEQLSFDQEDSNRDGRDVTT